MLSNYFKLFSILVVLILVYSTTEAKAPKSNEAKQQTAPNIIKFKQPAEFVCGEQIKWKILDNWKGANDSSICGAEPYYSVTGTLAHGSNASKLSAEIYVPEADKSWPASGGKWKAIDPADGTFTANFCIPTKGPDREFWFQLYAKDNTVIGEKCIVTVKSDL